MKIKKGDNPKKIRKVLEKAKKNGLLIPILIEDDVSPESRDHFLDAFRYKEDSDAG